MCGWIGIVLTGNDGVRRLDNQNSSPTRCDDVATLAIQTDQPRLRRSAACTACSMCRQVRRVSIGSGGWRPSRVRSRSRAAGPVLYYFSNALQITVCSFSSVSDARSGRHARRPSHDARHRQIATRSAALSRSRPRGPAPRGSPPRASASAARRERTPGLQRAIGRRAASCGCAWRPRRTVACVVMRRHMGRRSPSQHPGGLCERSRRGSAARRGCYTCGTKGRGDAKRPAPRAAVGRREARAIDIRGGSGSGGGAVRAALVACVQSASLGAKGRAA